MRALIQRVSSAGVKVNGELISSIEKGLLVFLGVMKGDTDEDLGYIASKVAKLRIFEDPNGKMNLSVKDICGAALVVSQFTLAAQTRKGNRPSFISAEEPGKAELMYKSFIETLNSYGISACGGQFGAMMDVQLTNDGPVTIMLDSRE